MLSRRTLRAMRDRWQKDLDRLEAAYPDKDVAGLGYEGSTAEVNRSLASAILAIDEVVGSDTPPQSKKTWPIDTDDQVEALARQCDWDNRKYMTPADYSIWCERMRKFARLAHPSPSASEAQENERLRAIALDMQTGYLEATERAEEAVKAANALQVEVDRFRAAPPPHVVRHALELAEGRLALILQNYPDESETCDHPGATRYVLESVRKALASTPEQGETPPSSETQVVGLPEKPPYEVLRAVAWMKVDPKSRRFEDTKGENEVIGFERAEEIYRNIRAALATTEGLADG